MHGNFIVNDGGATAEDVLQLIALIQSRARESRQIDLQHRSHRARERKIKMSDKPHRIAVLMGGPSAEREVSLRSGAAAADALREAGYEVTEVVVEDENFVVPDGTDLAFLALHGTFGEDGQVQDILDARGIPFTGADAETSRITIDKEKTKEKFRAARRADAARGNSCARLEEITLPLPVFIKPNSQGSSVGSRAATTPRGTCRRP